MQTNTDAMNFVEHTISDLQQAVLRGDCTYLEITRLYLERIATLDAVEHGINAVLEINSDALQIAEALDYEYRHQGLRGPLHGMPVLLKDNIDTGDKLHTSGGSRLLQDHYATSDSAVATQLRQAGAIILGKANMTEWANFIATDMPNGYSSRGGQVKNPYGAFDVGGSSAGSGAAVAANLATFAVGTETSGSILSPSSQNCVVGIKPTVGLISRTGIIPISHSQDTAGPMARTVRDVAIALGAMTSLDSRDVATNLNRGRTHLDYTTFLDEGGLGGRRLGVPSKTHFDGLDAAWQHVMNEALAALRSAGATLVEIDLSVVSQLKDFNVLLYEFKPDLNAYLRPLDVRLPVHSLAEAIAANATQPDVMLKYGQAIFLQSEATSGRLTEATYIQSRGRDLRLSREEGIDKEMKTHNLDAILFPANHGADIAAKAGYPSVCVPAGFAATGEPIGLTFTATAFSEPQLLRLAYAFEQWTKHRRPPQLK